MNKKIKILIVEDEYVTAKSISKFLSESGYEVVGISVNTEEAIENLENHSIDLVLLDINLNEERDGVWLANYINAKYKIPFIFLTAYSDKVTISSAIDSNPYSYLIKPFQKGELFPAIELAIKNHQEKGVVKKAIDSILLKDIDKYEIVNISDIQFIESRKNYLFVFTSQKEYKYRATIKEFLQKLPQTFIQVHRGFIVNTKQIEGVNKKEGVVLVGGNKVPLSKSHKKEVLEFINSNLL